MAFKSVARPDEASGNPELLFRNLKSRRIPGLLTQESDVIRDYMRDGVERGDVAIQLPTGSGKTLVGLLIGEWRRRRFGEHALFLCPTNQLVHQVSGSRGIRHTIGTHR